MAAQVKTPPQEAVEHVCPLPHTPVAASTVRRRVRAVLDAWNLSPEAAEEALLVVSELFTNAIVHALPPAVLRLCWRGADGLGTLHVEVTDGGSSLPTGRSAAWADPDEHGRGLGIVQALAARHGIRVHSGGITRWADLVVA
ncbi:ATP-binding protein [Streptomyces sp. GC420]|uniref:ATP-binding protein n=1 Tax=Streptomyces sp. GC420 TaxID=2697568 RepID=UPI00141512C9|nr:ATP-binding protein [Streptomyces sp. GC420]NBM14523.1 ATP-binding protein [Streptomyces sp. GC420]